MQWNNVALGKARAEKEMQAKEIEGVPINNASALEKNISNTTTTDTSSGQLTKQQLKELMAEKIKNDSNNKRIDEDSNESDSKTSKILNPSKKQKKVTISDEKVY